MFNSAGHREDGTVIKSAIKVWYITYLIQSDPKSPVSWTERRASLLPLFIPLSFSLLLFPCPFHSSEYR